MKRIKAPTPLINTREDMLSAMASIRQMTIRRNQLQADREAAILAIDKRIGPAIADIDIGIRHLTEQLQLWALANRPTEFGNRQSLDTPHGRLLFRIGNWTLETIKHWVWYRTPKTPAAKQVVLEALLDSTTLNYIRTRQEVDVQGLIAARELISPAELALVGLKFVRDESFTIEPKLDPVDNTAKVEAA